MEVGFHDQDIPNTLDLGWYWSEKKAEHQMAKIKDQDRATHLYIVGATRMGKTKFIEFLIQQDIEKENGFGVIDPHGDLIDDIKGFLASYCPEDELTDRVVVIDPTDPQYTVAINPLEKLPGVSAAEQARELVAAFKKVWSSSWGPRMEELLRNGLIALAEAGLTLVDLPSFLTSDEFRGDVLKKVSNPTARDYFLDRFNLLTTRGKIGWMEPVMNKLDAFLSDDRIRQIFSFTQSSFNLREVLDRGKILLINLDKGRLKDASDLLGSLLMAQLVMTTFSRSNIPPSQRRPFYLYVDEFQDFATDSFSVVLSEARKYGLSLTMAHQTLSQIPIKLRDLILGNCGIQVYFRVSRKDAQVLAKEAFEYYGRKVKDVWVSRRSSGHRYWSYAEEWEQNIAELQNLPPRCCYVKHKIEGGMIPIYTPEIEPPWKVLGIEEDQYQAVLYQVPFGKSYLLSREEIKEQIDQRKDKMGVDKVEPDSFRI